MTTITELEAAAAEAVNKARGLINPLCPPSAPGYITQALWPYIDRFEKLGDYDPRGSSPENWEIKAENFRKAARALRGILSARPEMKEKAFAAAKAAEQAAAALSALRLAKEELKAEK